MSANTKIEWADHTFNPWIGCTKVGPGCGSSCATCWTNEGNTMSQEINNELEFIRSILRGYKPSMARDDALYATARVKRLVGQDRAQRGEPVLWRYRDSEQCIRPMDGYTPGEGWTPLYDNPQPERKHTDADLAAEYERGRKAGLTQAYDAALAQQERQSHTEAEVQELLAFIGHYKAGTFDLGMIEQKVRRTLGVRL